MSLDIEAGLRRPKIDVHCHAWSFDDPAHEATSVGYLVAAGERLGISEFWCSSPITGGRMASMDEIRRENDAVLRAMKVAPGHVRGMCFVIPGYYREALAEVERCLDAGMTGVKLYNQYKICDPAVWPLLELVSERKVPLLEHAGYLTAKEDLDHQPLISHGEHFTAASEKYPDAILIHAHIGGGGDWERSARAMRNASPNVYTDTSGSNMDDGQLECAVAELGPERVLFGTDGTMEGSVGKVLDGTFSEDVKDLIFWGNAERILAAQGAKPLAR